MSELHLVSWNVNGIRAILKKDFIENVQAMNADIICLQETKAQPEDVKTALATVPDYQFYTNSSKARKGYSGTAILTRKAPIDVTYDMGVEEHDQEGRVITAEFDEFYLVTVYTPNSGDGLKRLDYRQDWDETFKDHITALDEKKPVIVCGDLNVAHEEIDIARPKANYNKSAGYTQQEIDGLDNLLAEGFFDSFRELHPEEIKYSWWNYRFQARERNVGWRIDYFLLSERLKDQLGSAEIYNEYHGSDHCPVAVKMKF
ncbi:exodeoxyribonuclease III [Marinoscillum sp. MHG1-6]|uniref:exodeoxyribonuclease III n=1 Tax=Marinoscillum sp. MHG1-6 TaxID=2959627 RepID=UPI00215827C5|nr:exodeoxyribonuclease III [Marinoscillum sp. MHG1-6]